MGFDLTKWATDEKLEDHVEKPIKITIEDFSEKYDIKITLQAFLKKKGD